MSPSPTGWPAGAAEAPASTGTQDPGVLADRVRSAVLSVPGVVAMHGGSFGEVATLLPGRRVAGVRLDAGGGSEVHVVASTSRPLTETAALVHRAVAPLLPGPVHVVLGDVATPAEQARREEIERARASAPRGA